MFNSSFHPWNESAFDQDSDNAGKTTGPTTIVIVNCLLNVPLLFISIFGNTMVLAAVLKTPSLRSPSIILLCGLAVSDLVVGLIVQPIYIAKELTSVYFLQRLTRILGASFCGISFATMSAISVDRFLALQYHMTYNSLVTSSRAKYTLILIWLINFLLFSGVNAWYIPEHFYLAFVLVGVYIIASTISYIGIYRIVRCHQADIYAQAVEYPSTQNMYNLVILTRTAVNTFVFYICTILCYLPWFIYRLFYSDILLINASEAWVFAGTLVFVNSAINPILYCWRLRDLRISVMKILRIKNNTQPNLINRRELKV